MTSDDEDFYGHYYDAIEDTKDAVRTRLLLTKNGHFFLTIPSQFELNSNVYVRIPTP